jgi:hypothetical protein
VTVSQWEIGHGVAWAPGAVTLPLEALGGGPASLEGPERSRQVVLTVAAEPWIVPVLQSAVHGAVADFVRCGDAVALVREFATVALLERCACCLGGQFAVAVERWPDRVRVELIDRSSSWPGHGPLPDDAEGGGNRVGARLAHIDEVANWWGFDRYPDYSRWWAELDPRAEERGDRFASGPVWMFTAKEGWRLMA